MFQWNEMWCLNNVYITLCLFRFHLYTFIRVAAIVSTLRPFADTSFEGPLIPQLKILGVYSFLTKFLKYHEIRFLRNVATIIFWLMNITYPSYTCRKSCIENNFCDFLLYDRSVKVFFFDYLYMLYSNSSHNRVLQALST